MPPPPSAAVAPLHRFPPSHLPTFTPSHKFSSPSVWPRGYPRAPLHPRSRYRSREARTDPEPDRRAPPPSSMASQPPLAAYKRLSDSHTGGFSCEVNQYPTRGLPVWLPQSGSGAVFVTPLLRQTTDGIIKTPRIGYESALIVTARRTRKEGNNFPVWRSVIQFRSFPRMFQPYTKRPEPAVQDRLTLPRYWSCASFS